MGLFFFLIYKFEIGGPNIRARVFLEHQYRLKRPYLHAYTHLYEHTRTPYLYEHLRETDPACHLEIYEVTVGASSSTETSPLTESASPEILK